MGKFLPQFDRILLLSAPAHVIAERLRSRTNRQYGTQPEELAQVMELLQTVEPLLRRRADHVLDTTVPLHDTVAAVLSFAR
jgi:shikimate kinase